MRQSWCFIMRQACSRSQGWLAGCRLSEAGCPCQPGLPGAVPAHADHRSSPAQPFHLAGRPAVSAFRLVMCLPWHPYISLCVAPDEMAPRESLLASWNPTAEAQELRCCALQACLKGIRAWAHCSCMGVCRQKVMQEGGGGWHGCQGGRYGCPQRLPLPFPGAASCLAAAASGIHESLCMQERLHMLESAKHMKP